MKAEELLEQSDDMLYGLNQTIRAKCRRQPDDEDKAEEESDTLGEGWRIHDGRHGCMVGACVVLSPKRER